MHLREGEVVGGEHPPEKILAAEEGLEEVEDKERGGVRRAQSKHYTLALLHLYHRVLQSCPSFAS